MTVPVSAPIKLAYAGDGVTTTPFTTPQFLSNGDITAVLTVDATGAETPLVLGTDYNLTGAGDPSGVLSTTGPLSPPAVGETLTIKGVPVLEQETDFVEGGDFNSTALESELDRSRLIDKSTAEDFSRTIQFPLSDTAPTAVLPPAQDRAGKVQTFDSLGSPTVTNAIELFTKVLSIATDTTINDTHAGALLRIDTTGGDVTLTFADTATLTTPQGDFCKISIADPTNNVILTTAVATKLRSQNGTAEWTATTDPVYGGTSDATNGSAADEAEIRVKRIGTLWVLNGDLREAATENREILTRKSLILQTVETGPYTFDQGDHADAKIFTGGGAENWTVPALSQGTTLVVHNIGAGTITFVASGVTLIGLVSLGPNNSASLSWLTGGTTVKLTGELS